MPKSKTKSRKARAKTSARKATKKPPLRAKSATAGARAWPGLPPGYFDRVR